MKPDSDRAEEARELLRRFGLEADPLVRAKDGEDNVVFLTPRHVIRLRGNRGYDHRKEIEPVRIAHRLGVRAAPCLKCEESWSIWRRLPGTNLSRSGLLQPSFCDDLFADLARLHTYTAPLETEWMLPWWATAQFRGLAIDAALREEIERIVPPVPNRLTFAHGDLNSNNVIVSPDGDYAGLVDWPDAGWWPPEIDYALLRSDVLNQARRDAKEPLDWRMVAYLRLMKTLAVVSAGALPIEDFEAALAFWREVA